MTVDSKQKRKDIKDLTVQKEKTHHRIINKFGCVWLVRQVKITVEELFTDAGAALPSLRRTLLMEPN